METIKVTKDYAKFSFLAANRELKGISKLIKSIEACDLTPLRPILVTSEFQIIDGQHRFEACKRLGKPIYYQVAENVDAIKAMNVLNTSQRTWHLNDYLHKYIVLGDPQYIELREFMQRHGIDETRIVAAITMFTGKDGGKLERDFRVGKIAPKCENADKIADYINSLDVSYKFTLCFVRSVIWLLKHHTPRECKKVAERVVSLPKFARVVDYQLAFTNILEK